MLIELRSFVAVVWQAPRPMQPAHDGTALAGLYNLMMKPATPVTPATLVYPRDRVLTTRDIGGVHFMFLTVWADSAEREWMMRDLATIPSTTPVMIAIAKAVTDAGVEEAAAYFSKVKVETFVKVVESATSPKTTVVGGMLAKHPEGGTEPIGNRLIEVPDDLEIAENRDSRTTYTAYVPMGSLKKGEALVSNGGGKTIQCAVCHGADLKGLGDVPRIAGRSPSYVFRQLYDIKNGTRSGSAALMQQVVAKLELEDMVAISAYVASKAP